MSADKPLSRLFRTDSYGDAVDVHKMYFVRLHRRTADEHPQHELVSGEDLLACAEILDQILERESNDGS